MTAVTFSRKDHSMRWIKVGDLTVTWSEAQRALSEREAAKIAKAFDPDLFGTLTVSETAEGKYHVDDGWTRASAVRSMWGDDAMVPCVVVAASNAVRAAQIFTGMNGGRSKPTAIEMFVAQVTAQSPDECAVNCVLKELGLSVENSSRDGVVRAASALVSIYRQYGSEHLHEVLLLIISTWGRDASAFDAPLMRGLALFLAQAEDVRMDRLARKLARQFTPGRLVGAGKAMREAFGGSMPRAVAALVQEAYAKGGRTTSKEAA